MVPDINWNWNEGLTETTAFLSYCEPSANVNFDTDNVYWPIAGTPFDSVNYNTSLNGNEGWDSNMNGNNIPLNNLNLNLVGSPSIDNVNPAPTSNSGSNYLWDFSDIPANDEVGVNVGSNNSSVSFTPGFDFSRSVKPTTFSASGIKS